MTGGTGGGCLVEVSAGLHAAHNNAGVPGPYVPLDEYGEYEFFPYLVLGWLAAGLVITAVIPGFAAKVYDGLERAAGIR